MSFARAKITRFNEKPSPRTDSASVLKISGSGMKSQIPKITKILTPHSQSTKDSVRSKCSLDYSNGQKKPQENQETNTVLAVIQDGNTAEKTLPTSIKDNSVKSEDFKDALDENKHNGVGVILEPLREINPLPIMKKESITSRKSSTSGIPLPVKNSTSRLSGTGGSPRARSDSRGSDKCPVSPTKRSLELQFLAKKKKLDQMKKELETKQKPVVNLYQSLLQIKKKLEDSGKIVPLENMKFWDLCEAEKCVISFVEAGADASAGGELVKLERVEIPPVYLENLRHELDPIPKTFMEMGRCLMNKRTDLLGVLETIRNKLPDNEELNKMLDDIRVQTAELHNTINVAVERQESRVERILKQVGEIFERSSLARANQIIADLEKKLKFEEKMLEDVKKELSYTQQQLKEITELTATKLTDENIFLKERVKILEVDIQTKKKKLAEQSSMTKTHEQKIDFLTKQANELEKAKKEGEGKISDLNSHVRTLQNKLKTVEQKWREEKEEIMKSHKGEHAILEKLTAERQTLDTRVHLMNNILDEQKKTNDAEQARLRQEATNAKAELTTVIIDKQILEDKLESLQQEVARLSVQQQQAVDVIKNTINTDESNESRGSIISEREAQLQTELLATQVALKAAQERIENYTAEKLRFIDSIEKLNGDGEKESLGKALVQKEELITQLEREKREAIKLVESQSVLISQLNAKVDNLQAGMVVNNLDNIPHDTQELKIMLEEGKAKLQKALTKSLDNEQKLIKNEHDLNQHKKQLNDMDNLLKVRDGLIGMLKAKKDDLVMENESLHKYSEEIRQLLFDTKEELKQKTEMIQDLSGNLDRKGRLCYKLEKKIKDLESTLSETNEKRFKLQDTVGTMEKELQSTKAHINQIAEMQTRYEIGMPLLNADVNTTHTEKTTKTISKPQCTTNHTNQSKPQQSTKYSKNALVPLVKSTFNDHGDTEKLRKFSRDGNCIVKGLKELRGSLLQENVNNGIKFAEGDVNKVPERYSPYKYSAAPAYSDASPNYLQNTYYINMQPYRLHSSFVKNVPTYNQHQQPLYYRPLTQSLLTIEQPSYKIHTAKNHSSLGLTQLRMEMPSAQKASSSTQTDSASSCDKRLHFLVRPNTCSKFISNHGLNVISEIDRPLQNANRDPYKICCDLLAEENSCTIEEIEPEISESKIKERREFIEIVKKLSQFDDRQRRDQLGLGKEFKPVLFEGISRYKVMGSGSLMWCRPTREMRLNNLLISKDIIAHSCHHVKNDVEGKDKIKTIEAIS